MAAGLSVSGNIGGATQPSPSGAIGQYGVPPTQPGGMDLSFLNNPYFQPGGQGYDQIYGINPNALGTGPAAGTASGQATAQRDAALAGQYGNLLSANNLYAQQTAGLQVAGIGSAEQYGAAQSGIQVAGINSAEQYGAGQAAINKTQIGNQTQAAEFQAGQQTLAQQSNAAASGSTVTQGNRNALGAIQTNLSETLKGLYTQLQQLNLGNTYRQQQEYQQLQGVNAADAYRQQTEYQQLQGIQYGQQNTAANYAYQQAANQTSITDTLAPYQGVA